MVSLVLKAHDTKPQFNTWLNCSFNLSQKYKFNQPVWNFQVDTTNVKWALPLQPQTPQQRKMQSAW